MPACRSSGRGVHAARMSGAFATTGASGGIGTAWPEQCAAQCPPWITSGCGAESLELSATDWAWAGSAKPNLETWADSSVNDDNSAKTTASIIDAAPILHR
jgi:hypothetical protein